MRINSEIGHWPCPIKICIVKKCKQQSWIDFQAHHQQIPNRLTVIQLRITSRSENRRDLGHVPQLFSPCPCGRHCALISAHSTIPWVPHPLRPANLLDLSRMTVAAKGGIAESRKDQMRGTYGHRPFTKAEKFPCAHLSRLMSG
jgi:hypothetical protein